MFTVDVKQQYNQPTNRVFLRLSESFCVFPGLFASCGSFRCLGIPGSTNQRRDKTSKHPAVKQTGLGCERFQRIVVKMETFRPSVEEISHLKYVELQRLAKKAGIKANATVRLVRRVSRQNENIPPQPIFDHCLISTS